MQIMPSLDLHHAIHTNISPIKGLYSYFTMKGSDFSVPSGGL